MPFCYQHPDYWHCIAAESKRAGDMVNSRKLFDDSETAHPIEPKEYIPVENIRGKLLLIGAEDDALWDTAKYIRRMEMSGTINFALSVGMLQRATGLFLPQKDS